MSLPKLAWFQLRFPQELEADNVLAALAALSGAPSRSRTVLELYADHTGISHRLGIRPRDTESVTATFRAAVTSLRLTPIDRQPTSGHPLLLQTSPALAALRTDNLAAISADLLSSLFPLEPGESVCLRWELRSWPLPPLPVGRYDAQDGRERVLRAKLTEPGMAATGELRVQAKTTARRTQLRERTVAVLWSLRTPYGRLLPNEYWFGQLARLAFQRGRYLSAPEVAAVIGWPIGGPDLPGLELGAAKRLVPSIELPDTGRVLGTSDAPGLTRPVAISEKASTRGLYVLGPTGTGKTSLLKHLIADDLAQGRGLAVVETNGDLITELLDAIPTSRIDDVLLLDPTDTVSAVGFNPFAGSPDPSLVADQLSELFQRLWEEFWGPRTAQLTHMGLLTLARRKRATLLDLPRLYLDPAFRARVLADLDDPLGLGPDWQWFERLPEREQLTVVAPLLNKVRAFTARPSIRAIVGQFAPKLSMRQIIEQKKILLVNVPKGLIGAETAQLLGCLVLVAIWQAATERAALPPDQRHAFGLYVDEVQDFADAPVPWDEMFAQGRKYGLAMTVAHQNLSQLPKELREVILANARSKAVFALSPSDAKVMAQVFAPALTPDDLQALDPFAIAAQVALDSGGLARPVTLTTPAPLSSLGTSERARTASRTNYARPRAFIEEALRRQVSAPSAGRKTPVGRQRRRPT
jgi:Type IV secretion-system coupling protein DNA-binding domain